MTALFARKAPSIMRAIMRDVARWDLLDAAAVLGNIGGETQGFVHLQEIKPVVAGSRGGYGWFQWTGPRRRAYEAWCRENRLDPASDEANYGFFLDELDGPERRTIAAVAAAQGLEAKTVAFERAFERAGIPHLASRIKWARLALEAYRREEAAKKPPPEPAPEPEPTPPQREPDPEPMPDRLPSPDDMPAPSAGKPSLWHRVKTWLGWGTGTGGGLGIVGYFTDTRVVLVIAVVVVLLVLLAFAGALWLFGKERVRDFIARLVRKVVPA